MILFSATSISMLVRIIEKLFIVCGDPELMMMTDTTILASPNRYYLFDELSYIVNYMYKYSCVCLYKCVCLWCSDVVL